MLLDYLPIPRIRHLERVGPEEYGHILSEDLAKLRLS